MSAIKSSRGVHLSPVVKAVVGSLVAVTLVAFAGGRAQAPPMQSIAVVVQDENGSPIAGATVKVGSVIDAVTTDAKGIASVRLFPRDTWVSATAPGYWDFFLEHVSVPEMSPLQVTLRRRR